MIIRSALAFVALATTAFFADTACAVLVAPGFSVTGFTPTPLNVNGQTVALGDSDFELGASLGAGSLLNPLQVDDISDVIAADSYGQDTIFAGTDVAIFQFDIDADGGTAGTPFSLEIAFGADILGVIFQGNPSDSAFDTLQEAAGPGGSLVGDASFTLNSIAAPADNETVITTLANVATINGFYFSGSDTDSFMIVTAAVPEIGALTIWGLLGTVGLVTAGRRSRDQAEEVV